MELAKIFRFKNSISTLLYRSFAVANSTKNVGTLDHLKTINFSSLSSNQEATNSKISKTLDLTPYNPVQIPVCGMKVRGQLQLRCRDCYFERKDGELYVNCSSFPRHKQRALRKRLKYRWLLTYAFQSKKRPY